MIDDKELEHRQIMASIFGPHDEVEIIRNARRYLALRENEIAILQSADNEFDADAYRAEHDAVADRLLENGL